MPTSWIKLKSLKPLGPSPSIIQAKPSFQLSHQWATFIRRVVIATFITRRSIIGEVIMEMSHLLRQVI